MGDEPVKRKVFISFFQGDRTAVDTFIEDFGDVFIPKALGVEYNDDLIDSTDTDYVMSQIREKYLADSTVTIVAIGDCTHSRRYVDWEIKTSLRKGSYTPNGLIGMLLPYKGDSANLPPRFRENWISENSKCFARYYVYPSSEDKLRDWIEDAHAARTERADLIKNSADMMKNNAKCKVHDKTHPA